MSLAPRDVTEGHTIGPGWMFQQLQPTRPFQPCKTDTAMNKEFKPGDVVTFNSSDQKMTVVDIGRETGVVFCRFLYAGESVIHAAPANTLLLFDPDD